MDQLHTAQAATIPMVRVRHGSVVFDIDSLDEALAFATAHPHPGGAYEEMLRLLRGATDPEDVAEAGHAFQWWAEATNLVAGPVRC
ncbi:hypothetical protein KHC24_22795 [Ancylobacter defluvii]|nr:hypothetical protein [Ancylobacter defluvii]